MSPPACLPVDCTPRAPARRAIAARVSSPLRHYERQRHLDGVSDDPETPRVLPQRQAVILGERLKDLTADDRVPLQQMRWQLRGEVRRAPDDLNASTALVLALSLAGEAVEARSEAARAASLLVAQRPVPPNLHLNVVNAMINAGFGEHAKRCLFLLPLEDTPQPERSRYARAMMKLAIMFGDEDLLQACRRYKALQLIEASGLMPFWPAQQAAVVRVLQARVASMEFETVCLAGGGEDDHLVLTYNTNICSWSELYALEGELWDALEAVYAEHPDGVGAMSGSIIIGVRGPAIPLEDLLP